MLAQALINPDKHGFHYSDELIKTVGRDWIKNSHTCIPLDIEINGVMRLPMIGLNMEPH